MSKEKIITADIVKERLNYDPNTGVFIWKAVVGKKMAGRRAGTKVGVNDKYNLKNGSQPIYIGFKVGNKSYRCSAHRVAWLYMTGRWPKETVDHINHDPADNRWCNLREASRSEQAKNRKMPSNNTSGVQGVYWQKSKSRWQACIRHNKKQIHLYSGNSFDEAVKARKRAERELGFHHNHGIIC